ncbi:MULTISPECIES: hypothetical protein [unclassified Rhodanobacter]|uniref:hypothetical protein n=1 Tax=unclassified Rhodanobacter TaxID=2621553 RepID=UPI00082ECAF5|nr:MULTISPECIES: hypothetical protein [unclassified Rhodanobacter]
MKVKDLIAALGKLDPNSDVYGYCEDESLQTTEKLFSVFFIDGANDHMAVTERNEKGNPTVKFDSGPGSRKLAFVNMTADF